MSTPTEAPRPRAVLVGVQLAGVTDAEQRSSLTELKRLCETLGFEVVGEVTQKRQGLGAATLLGEGKLAELAGWTGGTGVVRRGPPGKRKATEETDSSGREKPPPAAGEPRATVVVIDHDLSPAPAPQPRARDRRGGARSHRRDHRDLPPPRVEPRRRGCRSRSPGSRTWRRGCARPAGGERQRGGIGGKGAGESALELDRRKIRDRIAELKARAGRHRATSRRRGGRRASARRCASRWSATPTPASRR